MAGKRVVTMMVALSLGTAPVTLLSRALRNDGPLQPVRAELDLPWPYCGSDAEPPVYEEFPLPEGGPGFVVRFEPTTEALVPLVLLRTEPISIHELDLEGTEEGFDHTELAEGGSIRPSTARGTRGSQITTAPSRPPSRPTVCSGTRSLMRTALGMRCSWRSPLAGPRVPTVSPSL